MQRPRAADVSRQVSLPRQVSLSCNEHLGRERIFRKAGMPPGTHRPEFGLASIAGLPKSAKFDFRRAGPGSNLQVARDRLAGCRAIGRLEARELRHVDLGLLVDAARMAEGFEAVLAVIAAHAGRSDPA